jgi:hypothetical protein
VFVLSVVGEFLDREWETEEPRRTVGCNRRRPTCTFYLTKPATATAYEGAMRSPFRIVSSCRNVCRKVL